jgi:hypothetical protein
MNNLALDYPTKLDIPAAWYGPEMANNPNLWTYNLTSTDIEELEIAVQIFKRTKKPLGHISKYDFPLENLESLLNELNKELLIGRGFKLLRGLPIEDYSIETCAIMFCGIGSYLGSARSQNSSGHLLGHVRDTGADAKNFKTRIYQTNARQSFHTDSCDAVGLLCLKKAKNGGSSMLASSVTAYNEIAKRRPDLLPSLFEPVAYDRRGENKTGEQEFFTIPVFNWFENHLTCIYHRTYVDSAQRFENAPKLTQGQKEALDLLDEILNDSSIHFEMELEPGDMQFVYNHNLLHDRNAYTDWPNLKDRRHLFRLWLSLPNDRPLPPVFSQRYGELTIGNRGGIFTEETTLHAPIND